MYQWTSDFPFWTEVILTSAFLDFVMYDELVFRNMFFYFILFFVESYMSYLELSVE